MQMRILIVLVLAVALPWASAESEERGFLSKYNPFNGVVGRELTDEEVRGLGAIIRKALPTVIKGAKAAAPYVMSGVATLINGREEEEERSVAAVWNKAKKVIATALTEGSKYLINNAGKGREEEERSIADVWNKAKKVIAAGLTEGSKYLINNAAKGREEEELSLKSVFGKIGKVVGKVAPIAIAAGSLLGREEEERSFKSVLKGIGKVVGKVAPINLAAAPLLVGREEEERFLKGLLNKAKGLAAGALSLIGREEEDRSLKSVLKGIGKVVGKVAPIALAAAPLLVGRDE